MFGAPTHRLTARAPYQASPEAWLDAADSFVYSSGPAPDSDRIWWRLPATFETEFMSGVNFNFMGSPAEPAVLSLTFEAYPYQGLTGTVVIDIGPRRTEIPISATVERTVDIGFVHDGQDPVDARVFWRPGLIDFVFRSVTLGGGIIVLDPGPLA